MTPPAVMTEPARLFAVPDSPRGRSLEDAVLATLAEPSRSPCLVCDGPLTTIAAGVRCADCGSELAWGVDRPVAWAA